jgi:hypothetical protein
MEAAMVGTGLARRGFSIMAAAPGGSYRPAEIIYIQEIQRLRQSAAILPSAQIRRVATQAARQGDREYRGAAGDLINAFTPASTPSFLLPG